MAGILSYFLPKDKVFYSLFEQASDNLEAIAKKLVQVVQEPDFNKRAAYISEMQDIEHQNAERKGEVISLPLENVDSILKGMTGVKGNIDFLISDSEGFNPEQPISKGSLYIHTIAEIDSRYLIKLMTDNFDELTTWDDFVNDEDRFVKMDLDELLYNTNYFGKPNENCISILQNQLSNSSGCSELSWAEAMKTFEIEEWNVIITKQK